MEEVPEKDKESSHSACANGMNEFVVREWLERAPYSLPSDNVLEVINYCKFYKFLDSN
jgi:hypothetical protein